MNKNKKMKVFVAGPFFNIGERCEQSLIAKTIENAGYKTFLAQRNGIDNDEELKRLANEGFSKEKSIKILSRKIFQFDLKNVYKSDILVLNCDGLSVDDGSVVEATIAFSLCIPVILFYTDVRRFIDLFPLNPMILGLSSVEPVTKLDDLPDALYKVVKSSYGKSKKVEIHNLSENLLKTIIK